MSTSIIQRSFAAGEVAPAVYGRADQVKVQTGLAVCRNFFVRRHGGVSNRPGLQYITAQGSHSAKGRIWGFVFNADQTYLLLFENETLRFVRDGALLTVSGVAAWGNTAATITGMTRANPCVVTSAGHGLSNGQEVELSGIVGVSTKTITGATNANPCVITSAGHGFTNGTIVRITGVGGMTELNGNLYTVAGVAANTFELSGVDSSTYGVYTSGGNVYENGTNFTTLNGERFTVANVAANTFELQGQDTSAFSAYVSGGTATVTYQVADLVSRLGVNYYCILAHANQQPPNATYWYAMPAGDIYEIPTPYVTADLPTLQFSQSGDVVTITHKNYFSRDLSRTGHTAWTLALESTGPSIAAPPTLTNSGAAGSTTKWKATAVKSVTLEESVPSSESSSSATPSSGSPITLTIGAVDGAQEYNVYKDTGSGIFGFIGTSSGPTFIDNGITPDFDLTPPIARDPFGSVDDCPAVSGYYQQRKMYGNTTNAPEDLFGSVTGSFKNHTVSSPVQDNDAVQFTLAGRQVNEIRAIVEIGQLVVLTSGAEWIREGDATDPLTPRSPNLKPSTYNGSAEIAPIVIVDNLLYVQARGSIVRDFRFDQQVQGYTGRDLSVFAPHLFDKYTIVHWSYAQIPHSIVWIVRSDGALLGLTYLREHEIWGWHRHDTDGEFEDVCVIPEGSEDAVYVLVKRTINGATKRYLERFASRNVTDLAVDAKFMDSHLSYNGWHTGNTTMTLSTGTTWAVDETLTLTAIPSYFVAGDVDKTIVLTIVTSTYSAEEGWTEDTETLTCTITGYTSGTVVSVMANRDVPAAFQGVAITAWGKGVKQISGADHLEGKTVAILGDGNVVSNGIDEPAITISGGQFSTELERCYVVLHVGLPYCSDLQTLDLEVMGGETLADKKKSVNTVTALVESSRGVWAGEPDEKGRISADDLYEYPQRTVDDEYDMIEGVTGKIELSIKTAWNVGGRVHFRQRDPLPLTILASIPSVEVGG